MTEESTQTSERGEETPGPGPGVERAARWMTLALITVGVVVQIAVSWNRSFQIDEVEHLHAGYHVASGRLPYVDFWQLHDPLLYGLLGPITDPEDPAATYRRGRLLMLSLLLATVAAAALAARRLVGPAAAALAAGLLLFHTTFAERAIEVRPDGLAAFLVVAALALQLGERDRRLGGGVAAGALLGLALLATKKTVYVGALFGLWWCFEAWRRRRPSPLAPALGTTLVLLSGVGLMGSLGMLGGYVEATWRTSMEAVGGSEIWISFEPTHVLWRESRRNLPFVVLALAGWLAAVLLFRRGDAADRRLLFPAVLAAGALGSLWLQPFPWPYVHLGMLPLLAVVAGAGVLRALVHAPPRWRRHPWSAVAVALSVTAAAAAPRLAHDVRPDDGPKGQARQLALLDEVQRATAPDDPVFDMAGLYFRPDAYPAYSMSSDLLRLMQSGGLPPLLEELRGRGAVAMLVNYRVDWLTGEQRDFFAYRFVHLTDNLFVLGADLGGAPAGTDLRWEALAERDFRWEGPPGALLVDDEPFARGRLSRGFHTLRLQEGVRDGRLVLDVPPLTAPPRPAQPLYIQFD